jgi:hypothetical protein
MRFSLARLLTCIAVAAFSLGLTAMAQAQSLPQSSDHVSVRVVGEALSTALPRLGKGFHLQLAPDRELEGQRVTLSLKDASIELLARGLLELLSAGPEAPVSWVRRRESLWLLVESANRRRVSARLRDQDLDLFRQHMERELHWFRRDAPRELEQARKHTDTGLINAIDARLPWLMVLDNLGEAGREKLLAGVPFCAQVGQMPAELRDRFRRHVDRNRLFKIGEPPTALPPEELDRYWFALVLARAPGDPQGTHLIDSWITPEGFRLGRLGHLSIPGPRSPAFLRPAFQLPPVEESDRQRASRTVSLMLTPAQDTAPGTIIRRNLDELLAAIGEQLGLNVIADGYRRSSTPIPANLAVTDYPLEKLLDAVTRLWQCDWRFLDADKKTVLVRARGWWLEDEADLPDAVVADFRDRFAADKSPALTDLLRLAELSKAQVHKLMESGLCPGATGIVIPGFYDDAGVKPCLQFFNRLPPALQQRAQSPQGLPLREAPRELVEKWLLTTLIVDAGAVTPEMQNAVVFSIRPGSQNPETPVGIEVAIHDGPNPLSTHWVRYVQPPRRPGQPAQAVANSK